ncbi:MAG: hypothetical protein IPJ77_10095 [Planctomycetes bacterium]|nr:hypothetical protein [Planctomycetota bacterium]
MNDQSSPTSVADRLKVPGILLIVLGVLTDLGGVWQIVSNAFGIHLPGQEVPPGMEDFMRIMETFGIAFGVLNLISGVLLVLGGLSLMRQKSYGLAMTAAILAMVPGFSCCCLFSLPVGIWALMLLLKPEVKAAFQGSSAS